MRVLVAGGTGAIGQSAVPMLVAGGAEVTAVSRRVSSDEWLREVGAIPIRLDLFDEAAVRRAADGAEVLVNLATSVPSPARMVLPWAWRDNDRLRGKASHVLARAAAEVGAAFVQESFAPTYADGGDDWITEDQPLAPVAQTRTVADAEAAARSVRTAGGRAVVLRFGIFYGPGAASTEDLLDQVRRGWFPAPGPVDRYVSMVFVEDAARAVVAAVDAPAGTYNVVEDAPMTLGAQCGVLADLLGLATVRPLPAWMGHLWGLQAVSRSHRISNRRLRAATSWEPIAPDVRAGWSQTLDHSSAA